MTDKFIKLSSFEEALKQFEYMEKELELSEWQIKGVYVWKLLRFSIFSEYRMLHGLAEEGHPEVSRIKKKKSQRVLEFAGNFFVRNPFVARSKYTDRIVIPSSRKQLLGDELVDLVSCRAWSGDLEKRSLVLDRISILYAKTITGKSDYAVSSYLGWLIGKAQKIHLTDQDNVRIRAIKNYLGKNIENVRKVSLDARVVEAVRWFIGKRIVFQSLFMKTKPKAIYVVCGYGLEAPIAAAKELGIPSAEFQHGSMDRGHPGYDFVGWERVPYYADHLLTWGESWYRDTAIPKECSIHQVGAPHIEDAIREARQSNYRQEKKLLVLSQGAYGKMLMEEVVEFAKRRDDWLIVVRPHPGESIELLNSYILGVDSRVFSRIKLERDSSLAEAAGSAEVALGVHSTALIECMLAGCKVAIMRLPNADACFQPLVDDGNACVVKSGADLSECIDDIPLGTARGYFSEPIEDVCSIVEGGVV